MAIPTHIFGGDTVEFTINALYQSPEYTIKCVIRGPSSLDIDAQSSGGEHVFVLTAAQTATLAPGLYQCFIYAQGENTRHHLASAQITIAANPATTAAGHDPRTHAQKVLAAIEALLEGRAAHDAEQYAINGISLTKMNILELLKWRDKYRIEINNEQRLAASGASRLSGRIITRFV